MDQKGSMIPIPEPLKEIISFTIQMRNEMPSEVPIPAILVRVMQNAKGEQVRQVDFLTMHDGGKDMFSSLVKHVLKTSKPDYYAFITEGWYKEIEQKDIDAEDPISRGLIKGEIQVSMLPDRKEMLAITFGDGTYEALARADIIDGKVIEEPTHGMPSHGEGRFTHLYHK